MNPVKYFKILDNEECPCGRGKVFKNCCKGKVDIPPPKSKKPPEVQVMERMRKAMEKCCLHPDQSNCRGKIKNAHALQNKKILSLLCEATNRHVYIMNSKKQPLIIPLDDGDTEVIIEFDKTSVNDATTETCFCGVHDDMAFSLIEKDSPDFNENSGEMKFLYSYKAFIFEYYKLIMAYRIFQQNFYERPSVFQLPEMVGLYRMYQLKMSEIEPIKKFFDNEILCGTYNGITTCTIKIPERIHFANYAYIAPDYDLNGKKIRHTKNGVMYRLTITVFPEENQSYILLSCRTEDIDVYRKFFKQIESAPIDKVKYYFSMILPLYSENIVLSPKLWDSWDEDIRMAFTFYANLKGKTLMKYSFTIGCGLRNAAKSKTPFDYSKRGKIDLFPAL